MGERIAVFFDAENVSAATIPQVTEFLCSMGDVVSQRAYADWSLPNMNSWKEQLEKTPITAIQQFHHNEKQAVDKTLMMDAIEMALRQETLTYFAIVASDKGYHSLALRLRELGKKVIGVGEKGKSSPIWIGSCNEFHYFDEFSEKNMPVLLEDDASAESESGELKDFSLEKFIERAFDATPFYKDTNTKLLSQVWERVLRLKPDFNCKDFKAKSPRDLIESLETRFSLSDDGKSQKTFFVEKREGQNPTGGGDRKDGTVKRWINFYCILSADDGSGDYFFYLKEMNPEFKDKKLEKGMKINFLVTKSPDLNASDSRTRNGRATDVLILPPQPSATQGSL